MMGDLVIPENDRWLHYINVLTVKSVCFVSNRLFCSGIAGPAPSLARGPALGLVPAEPAAAP